MLLTIDIGNSNIVVGSYNHEKELIFSSRMNTDRTFEADTYAIKLYDICRLYSIDRNAIEGIIMSSVVPAVTAVFSEALYLIFGKEPVLFSQELHTGITVDIDNPAELGNDILACAVAVAANYPLPSINIDMGTATTLTALTADKRLTGVSIAPGVYISLEALTGKASQLQGVSLQAPAHAIGRNTIQSMQSGIVLGTASMIDGMIARFKQELGDVKTIVATGGASSVIVPHCQTPIIHLPNLQLDGLYEAYYNNI